MILVPRAPRTLRLFILVAIPTLAGGGVVLLLRTWRRRGERKRCISSIEDIVPNQEEIFEFLRHHDIDPIRGKEREWESDVPLNELRIIFRTKSHCRGQSRKTLSLE